MTLLRAFVSSTFEDLKEHRAHVIAALRKAGIFVDPMEDWTASADEPKIFSQARVTPCDLCVLLVAFRRGHVPEGDKESVTQLEYRAAVAAGMDVLIFMLKEDSQWRRQFDELDKDPAMRPWRGELQEHRGVGFFDHRVETVEIGPALSRWLQERAEKERAGAAPSVRSAADPGIASASASGRRRYGPLILALLLLPAYLAIVRSYVGLGWGEALTHGAFLGLSGVTIAFALALDGAPGGYKRLVHSAFVDALRRGRRASITRPLAWHELSYEDGGTVRTTTVVAELAEMLSELPIHAVVIRPAREGRMAVTSRDQFALDAAISPVGLVLRSVVTLADTNRALELAERLERDLETPRAGPEHLILSVPLRRIVRWEVLKEMFLFRLVLPASWLRNVQVTVTRLFLRHVLATALYRDRDPAGRAIVREMMDLGDLLPALESEGLGRMFMAAVLNLAAVDEDFGEAFRACVQARRFAPNDSQVIALQTLLSLALGRLDEGEHLTGELDRLGKDPGLGHWLKADILNSARRHREAIAEYEAALHEEPDSGFRGKLHFQAAFAYAMADDMPARKQGDGMIRHLEDALQLGENPVLLALKGYGFALRGDGDKSQAMFDRATERTSEWPEDTRPGTRNFVEHWRAKALRKLGKPADAVEAITRTGIAVEETEDVASLIVLAGAALDRAGSPAAPDQLALAEKYLNCVIKLDPNHGEAFKLRATVHLLYAQDASEPAARSRYAEASRTDFLRAIRLGCEMPEMHVALSRLYEMDGDAANALKHSRRWHELAPRDPQARAELAYGVLDETGSLQEASTYLENLSDLRDSEEGRRRLGGVYRRLAARAVQGGQVGRGVMELARDCMGKAIELGDDDAATYELRAALQIDIAGKEIGSPEFDKAVEYQRMAVVRSPGEASALTQLGKLLARSGRHEEARQLFEQAATLKPQDAAMFEEQGEAWQASVQLEDAARAFRKALDIDPSNVAASQNLGFVLFDLGDAAGALQAWQAALQSDPSNADAMAGKAAALHELGKDEEGFEAYTQAVALSRDFLDTNTMATKYLWSATAIAAVKGYLGHLSSEIRPPTDVARPTA